nr:hypothetical protein [Desulfobacula sp.]
MWAYFYSLQLEWILIILSMLLTSLIIGRKVDEKLRKNPIALDHDIYFLQRINSITFVTNFLSIYCLIILVNEWFVFKTSTISCFNSIFELSFGLNIIFYVFNLLPNFKDMLQKILEKAVVQEKEIEKFGGKKTTYDFGMHLLNNYNSHVSFAKAICWFGTSVSALFLLISGFYPEIKVYNWIMLSIILSVICPTLLSIINVERVKRWAMGFIEKRMIYRDHLKYGMPYEENPNDFSYAGIEDYVRYFKNLSKEDQQDSNKNKE